MKKSFIILLFYSAVFAFISCQKAEDNPFITEAEKNQYLDENGTKFNHFGYISGNDIYYWDQLNIDHVTTSPVRVTKTPDVLKQHLRISFTHDKVAYLDTVGSPVILDMSGNEIERLPQYTKVLDYDWSLDGKTLWMYNADSGLVFHGQKIDVTPYLGDPSELVHAMVSPNKDVAYLIKYMSVIDGNVVYRHKLILCSYDRSKTPDTINYVSTNLSIKSLRFVGKKSDLVIGLSSAYGTYVDNFYLYSDLKTTQDYILENPASWKYDQVFYNSVLHKAYTSARVDIEIPFALNSIDLDTDEIIRCQNAAFKNTGSSPYLDFK